MNALHTKQHQRGMALVVTLVILVMISVLGVLALRTGLLQNRISLNSRIDTMAFQSAEAGLKETTNEALKDAADSPTNVVGASINSSTVANGAVIGPGGVLTCPPNTNTCVVYRCVNRAYASATPKQTACGTGDRMDASGRMKVETKTRFVGTYNVTNSSVGSFKDYGFETASTGCMADGSGACDATATNVNIQELKRVAPLDATSTLN